MEGDIQVGAVIQGGGAHGNISNSPTIINPITIDLNLTVKGNMSNEQREGLLGATITINYITGEFRAFTKDDEDGYQLAPLIKF